MADWVARPDKKSRDAFISSEVVPLIQQLNMDEYGPEHISKDKVMKELWERRIQVCGHVFAKKNHFFSTGHQDLV